MKVLNFVMSGVLSGFLGEAASAAVYSPEALGHVMNRVLTVRQQGRQAVVLFDLDDTLVDTRERNIRILRELASQPAVQLAYPVESRRIMGLRTGDVRYRLPETLKGIGIVSPLIVARANEFWAARFFTDMYCAFDLPNPGAANYLQTLVRAGAKIVYLTGRDTPRMGRGTFYNLVKNGFPAAAEQAMLMMKPDPKMDDLLFKQRSFARIAPLGEVVGVFENEPANLNAMMAAFPRAIGVFLDTVHSPKPDGRIRARSG